MRSRANEDPKAALERLLLRASGELQWLSAAPFDVSKAGAISAENAEAISDHADEAEEMLVGALLIVRPDLPELEAAGKIEMPVPRRSKPRGRKAKATLLGAIEDILVLLAAEIQGAISDVYQAAQESEKASIEAISNDVEDAHDSIEAALLTIAPEYYKQELAGEPDPDERIAKAARLEYIEARGAEVRQTNEFSRLLSDASKKIHALEEAKGPTAELVARLISNVTAETAESTVHQLVHAAELTEGEARAFVGFHLVPQRLA